MFDKHKKHTKESAAKELSRLHNRHHGRLFDRLKKIKVSQEVLRSVGYELSLYTNDIRENIIGVPAAIPACIVKKDGGQHEQE